MLSDDVVLREARAQLLASMERYARNLDDLRHVWGEEMARIHLVSMLLRLGLQAAVRPEEINMAANVAQAPEGAHPLGSQPPQ